MSFRHGARPGSASDAKAATPVSRGKPNRNGVHLAALLRGAADRIMTSQPVQMPPKSTKMASAKPDGAVLMSVVDDVDAGGGFVTPKNRRVCVEASRMSTLYSNEYVQNMVSGASKSSDLCRILAKLRQSCSSMPAPTAEGALVRVQRVLRVLFHIDSLHDLIGVGPSSSELQSFHIAHTQLGVLAKLLELEGVDGEKGIAVKLVGPPKNGLDVASGYLFDYIESWTVGLSRPHSNVPEDGVGVPALIEGVHAEPLIRALVFTALKVDQGLVRTHEHSLRPFLHSVPRAVSAYALTLCLMLGTVELGALVNLDKFDDTLRACAVDTYCCVHSYDAPEMMSAQILQACRDISVQVRRLIRGIDKEDRQRTQFDSHMFSSADVFTKSVLRGNNDGKDDAALRVSLGVRVIPGIAVVTASTASEFLTAAAVSGAHHDRLPTRCRGVGPTAVHYRFGDTNRLDLMLTVAAVVRDTPAAFTAFTRAARAYEMDRAVDLGSSLSPYMPVTATGYCVDTVVQCSPMAYAFLNACSVIAAVSRPVDGINTTLASPFVATCLLECKKAPSEAADDASVMCLSLVRALAHTPVDACVCEMLDDIVMWCIDRSASISLAFQLGRCLAAWMLDKFPVETARADSCSMLVDKMAAHWRSPTPEDDWDQRVARFRCGGDAFDFRFFLGSLLLCGDSLSDDVAGSLLDEILPPFKSTEEGERLHAVYRFIGALAYGRVAFQFSASDCKQSDAEQQQSAYGEYAACVLSGIELSVRGFPSGGPEQVYDDVAKCALAQCSHRAVGVSFREQAALPVGFESPRFLLQRCMTTRCHSLVLLYLLAPFLPGLNSMEPQAVWDFIGFESLDKVYGAVMGVYHPKHIAMHVD